jgi:hypothetical protein
VNDDPGGFELRSALHLVRPTGRQALDLAELRDELAAAPDEVLFCHTVQYQLRHADPDLEWTDDVSAWIGGVVQDRETAERCAFVAQAANGSPAELRAGLLALLDALPAKARRNRGAPQGGAFVFLASETLALETGEVVRDAFALLDRLTHMAPSVRFYHLVEEPWYHGGESSLAAWLDQVGEARMAKQLRERIADRLTFPGICRRLLPAWRRLLVTRRVSSAADTFAPRSLARERDAAVRLVHRIRRRGGAE